MIFVCVFYGVYTQAQCFDLYVKTPNNGNVKACTGGGYSASQVQSAEAYSRTFAISPNHVYGAGTNSYNCHGYAWHVKEGGNKVWINNLGYEANNLSTYWTDGSYSVYNYNSRSHVENLKVFYGYDDHTAVTTSDPNVFISKMGCGALVAHNRDNSPYVEGNFTYYKKNIPTISGPDIVCSSGATFSIENFGGAQVTWSSHPLILPVGSTTGASCIFRAQGNMEDVWVRATLTFPSGESVSVQKDISRAGPPLASLIDYVWHPLGGILFTYDGQTAEYNPSEGIYFEARSGVSLTPFPPVSSGYISPTNVIGAGLMNPADNTLIEVRYYSECGPGAWKSITIDYNKAYSSRSVASAYPHPASDILNIEFDREALAQVQALSSAKPVSREAVFDIRLYDGQGNLLRQQETEGSKVQFNVSSLPNGIYYLHIYDGSGEKPQINQIIVNH
jgi:hypothetical protein